MFLFFAQICLQSLRVGYESISCPDADLFRLISVCSGFKERQELLSHRLNFIHVICIDIDNLAAAAKELLCLRDMLCKVL